MNDKTGSPEVAVIIIAHNRRRFVGRAMDSVLHQALPADRLETVVVTNFQDPQIDSRCASMGAKAVVTDAVPQGAKVLAGLRNTTAPLVSILEDDDVYYPGKLSNIADFFRANPDVAYLHNNWKYFREESELDPRDSDWPIGMFPIRIGGKGPSRRCAGLRGLRAPYFNSSSVSFRRRILEPHLSKLEQVNYILDVFLFFIALASAEDLLFSPQVLTGVGIGSENVSLGGGEPGSFRRSALEWYSDSILPNYRYIEDVARASRDPEDLGLAMSAALVQQTVGYLRGLSSTNRQLFRGALKLLQSSSNLFVREDWPVIPLSFLGAVSPSAMRSVYWRFREVASRHIRRGFL